MTQRSSATHSSFTVSFKSLRLYLSLPSQQGAVIVSNNILTAGAGMLLSPLDKELRRHFLEGDGLKKVVISLSGRMIITTCPTAQLTSVMGDQWRCWSDTQLLKQTTDHTLGYSDTQVITHSVTQHIPPIKHPVIYMGTVRHWGMRSVKYADFANTESIKHWATQTHGKYHI